LLCGAGPELNAPWLERELEWVAAADRAGTALFAVGTGAHTLALALGGDSAPSGRAQRGWINVLSADPSVLPDGPWFAWQDRVLRLPERAELLASSALGAQAFRLGRHIGVQFHPEITPELIRQWIPRSPQLLDSQGIQEATERDFPLAAPAARKLFASFLDASAA
jgi:GMP synthase-like glutamine amidotransferase